jgi:hypothetical protein
LIYQPANRFWVFQSIETCVFLALAAVAIGIVILIVRRRLA